MEIVNLPIFCSHCKMHGHGVNERFLLHPHIHKEKAPSKVLLENNNPVGDEANVANPLGVEENMTPLEKGNLFILQDSMENNTNLVIEVSTFMDQEAYDKAIPSSLV
ncbi:hypothetical protein IEQ34_018007 [Dendrobium chrysotoxum]|uniref:Uncharacterized protein n=1 Tax=Dendrobium chrysotoxum TaxID=161865 RepID=A0AAV7GDB7_DENCH|nr:hypothetical protein IEQ34_018007 [Dendrobium chrysotoxum]